MRNILEKVLLSIKPDAGEEEEIKRESLEFISKLNGILKKLRIKAKIVIGGSFAKQTTIKKDKYDVDMFVVFEKKYKSEEISDLLEKALRRINAKFTKLPGSRDYFNIGFKKFRAEIVPVTYIKKASEAKNITDVSMLHVNYVKNKILKNKKLSDDIRLAKAICYANNCYGAESHIKGLSGYCLEILTIYYKGFFNLVKNAAKWKDKVIIDPEKHYKKKNVLLELNEAKLLSPLILIDPIQPNRNAAAALSKEKFDVFTDICRKFVKKQSEKFFEKKKTDERKIIENAKKGRLSLYMINAVSLKKKEDISGAKLLKLFNLLSEKLKKEGYASKAEWDFKEKEARMWFSIKKIDKIMRAGPFIDMKKHLINFKKKYKKCTIKNKRIYAFISPKPLNEIFSIDKKQLSDMGIDEYKFRKIV